MWLLLQVWSFLSRITVSNFRGQVKQRHAYLRGIRAVKAFSLCENHQEYTNYKSGSDFLRLIEKQDLNSSVESQVSLLFY